MKRRRWPTFLLTLLGLAGLTGGAYYWFVKRPLPRLKGKIKLPDLHSPVEINFDRFGVPHVYAKNEDDLYYAQGYLHAQDRLWQMELNRRLGSGRLSEIIGPATLELDRFCRRIGLHRAAAATLTDLPEHDHRILNAYARGINAYIELNRAQLPLEFRLLRFQPEPWKAVDSIQWAKMMAWNLGGNWESEIVRAQLVAQLGPQRASQLEAGYDPSHTLILPPGATYEGINTGLFEQYQKMQEITGLGPLGGSNNWVVDGTMTASGSPILCNDPHLGQALPSVWYECHLVAGDIDVVGASFPGTPGIVIGHNQQIAWGITNAVSDVQDLYIEQFDSHNTHLYKSQNRWLPATIIKENIHIKGRKKPVVEEVRITHHGPIISELQTQKNSPPLPLALRWIGYESSTIVSSVRKINRAGNWQEFRNGLRDWDSPAQNFVYADQAGNIGYLMAGNIPIREGDPTLLPIPGWTGKQEWTGYIPFDELPQSFNPRQHFIATANNRVIDDKYPYYITHEWLSGYRAQRIQDMLKSKKKLTLDDMAQIQMDYFSIPAQTILPFFLQREGKTAIEQAALAYLKVWDFQLAPESVGAAIYSTCQRKLEHYVLHAILGPQDNKLFHGYLGLGANVLSGTNGYRGRFKPLLIRLLKQRDANWFRETPIKNGPQSWDEAIERAFQAGLEELQNTLGNDLTRWQYGKIHKMTYRHSLGAMKPLDRIFNSGPYAVGGDRDTINMGASQPDRPQEVTIVPSYRQIIDLDNLNNSRSIHAPGQSGQLTSKHYEDFVENWLQGKYHPMLYDYPTIQRHLEGQLTLSPNRF